MLRRRFLTLVSLFVLAVATSTPYTLHAQNAVTTAIGAAADGYAIVILADPPLADQGPPFFFLGTHAAQAPPLTALVQFLQ